MPNTLKGERAEPHFCGFRPLDAGLAADTDAL